MVRVKQIPLCSFFSVHKSPQSSASRINPPWRHKEDGIGNDNPTLSQLGSPDVTIEEVLDETQDEGLFGLLKYL